MYDCELRSNFNFRYSGLQFLTSDVIDEPLPGFLVGGPNPGKQDGCEYPSLVPDEAYVDILPSYASNEIAINWQGMFTYYVMALDATLRDIK